MSSSLDITRTCYNCKLFATEDSGYSNWTVMDTEAVCLKKHWGPLLESYSWRLKDAPIFYTEKAKECGDFIRQIDGRYFARDVECETKPEHFSDDPDIFNALKEYYK